jgi:hypothetical protein
MQQFNPARGRHTGADAKDSTKHTVLKLCFQSQLLTTRNWLVLIVCFDSAVPAKRKRRGSQHAEQ